MKKILFLITLLSGFFIYSQENVGYQNPPKEILESVEIEI